MFPLSIWSTPQGRPYSYKTIPTWPTNIHSDSDPTCLKTLPFSSTHPSGAIYSPIRVLGPHKLGYGSHQSPGKLCRFLNVVSGQQRGSLGPARRRTRLRWDALWNYTCRFGRVMWQWWPRTCETTSLWVCTREGVSWFEGRWILLIVSHDSILTAHFVYFP